MAWDTANDAVLAEGKRDLINDVARFDSDVHPAQLSQTWKEENRTYTSSSDVPQPTIGAHQSHREPRFPYRARYQLTSAADELLTALTLSALPVGVVRAPWR